MGGEEARRCVRPAALVLLWVWAICVFMILDLEPYSDQDFVKGVATRSAATPSALLQGGVADRSALPAIARRFGPAALSALLSPVHDPAADTALRPEAARLLAANEAAPLPLRTAALWTFARIDDQESTDALGRVEVRASATIARRAHEARTRKEG
jgi:hypothetical protein